MTIEQMLMKDSKSCGGLTHGRGTEESGIGKLTLRMPMVVEITNKLSKFCQVDCGTIEQHSYGRQTRIERDDQDLKKFMDWFLTHSPFPQTNG